MLVGGAPDPLPDLDRGGEPGRVVVPGEAPPTDHRLEHVAEVAERLGGLLRAGGGGGEVRVALPRRGWRGRSWTTATPATPPA